MITKPLPRRRIQGWIILSGWAFPCECEMNDNPNNTIMHIEKVENYLDAVIDILGKITLTEKQTKAAIEKAKIHHSIRDILDERIPDLKMCLGYVGTEGDDKNDIRPDKTNGDH